MDINKKSEQAITKIQDITRETFEQIFIRHVFLFFLKEHLLATSVKYNCYIENNPSFKQLLNILFSYNIPPEIQENKEYVREPFYYKSSIFFKDISTSNYLDIYYLIIWFSIHKKVFNGLLDEEILKFFKERKITKGFLWVGANLFSNNLLFPHFNREQLVLPDSTKDIFPSLIPILEPNNYEEYFKYSISSYTTDNTIVLLPYMFRDLSKLFYSFDLILKEKNKPSVAGIELIYNDKNLRKGVIKFIEKYKNTISIISLSSYIPKYLIKKGYIPFDVNSQLYVMYYPFFSQFKINISFTNYTNVFFFNPSLNLKYMYNDCIFRRYISSLEMSNENKVSYIARTIVSLYPDDLLDAIEIIKKETNLEESIKKEILDSVVLYLSFVPFYGYNLFDDNIIWKIFANIIEYHKESIAIDIIKSLLKTIDVINIDIMVPEWFGMLTEAEDIIEI